MDQSNYLNRLRLLFDKKLEQEPKELKNSIEQIMSKAISGAVAKPLDYSKFNQKFHGSIIDIQKSMFIDFFGLHIIDYLC